METDGKALRHMETDGDGRRSITAHGNGRKSITAHGNGWRSITAHGDGRRRMKKTRPTPAAGSRMTAETAEAPHQTAAGLSYASGPASSADLTAGQRAQVKVPGERTRESALDTSPPSHRPAAVSPMGGKGGAQGPQPTPLIAADSEIARSGRRGRDPGALRSGVRSACDSERPSTGTHEQSWSLDGCRHESAQLAFVLVRALDTSPELVVRGRVELPTFAFQAGRPPPLHDQPDAYRLTTVRNADSTMNRNIDGTILPPIVCGEHVRPGSRANSPGHESDLRGAVNMPLRARSGSHPGRPTVPHSQAVIPPTCSRAGHRFRRRSSKLATRVCPRKRQAEP